MSSSWRIWGRGSWPPLLSSFGIRPAMELDRLWRRVSRAFSGSRGYHSWVLVHFPCLSRCPVRRYHESASIGDGARMLSYLIRLTPRAGGLAIGAWCFSKSRDTVAALLMGFAGRSPGFLNGDGAWSAWSAALYFSSNSPILALRKATGMRFIRRSSRARRSWAWRAYCARSLRARSVTYGRQRHAQSRGET